MSEVLFSGSVAFVAKPNANSVLEVVYASADPVSELIPTTAESLVLKNGATLVSMELTLKSDSSLVTKLTILHDPSTAPTDWQIKSGFIGKWAFDRVGSVLIEPTPENGFKRPLIKTSCIMDYRVILTPGIHAFNIS